MITGEPSSNFARTVAPVLGRPFMADEIESGAHVALLTDALWRRRFGGDPSAVGRSPAVFTSAPDP